VRDETGALLRQASDVAPGQRLDVQFSDGHVAAQADGDAPPPAPAPAARPKRGKDKGGGDQGSLF
jgi:exodeoxyribonuclease VII large subunit